MSETEETPSPKQNQPKEAENIRQKFEKMNMTLSIWPPSQRTRDAVTNRLIETLSAPSILSKRYGSLSADEASSAAKIIEEEAFTVANSSFLSDSKTGGEKEKEKEEEDDGIVILQIYSKEISKRMLEAVKAKAVASVSPDQSEHVVGDDDSTAASEEISSA
ncbi:hypothetical protein IFM89_029213 [Coptis chinensis]|uniref:WPP domain-containing protein n=1 Tax=Coptis chinensis TaxID=261450 RepID=A0A835IS41_9MAGN|nr:hypothetical protein IFM89_029213 [Coptis chinensis]